MDRVGRAGGPILREILEFQLELGQGVAVEQLAQLFGPEELAQQVAVEGERLGPPVDQGRVAFIHVLADVGEHERAGERRGVGGLDAVDRDFPLLDGAQHVTKCRQVEDVTQALAVRLEQDGERPVLGDDRQELRGALAHLPERRPRPGPAPGQEQRSGSVLAEACGEERGAAEDRDDEILDLVRLQQDRRLHGRQHRLAD